MTDARRHPRKHRRLLMNEDLVTAVKRLVDSITFRDSIDISGSDAGSIVIMQECVDDILKRIRATPEMSSLHTWADRQLAGDYDDPASYEAGRFLSDRDIQAAREHGKSLAT
jgi:hypothetical protein